jgi:hypothetical protein
LFDRKGSLFDQKRLIVRSQRRPENPVWFAVCLRVNDYAMLTQL